MNNNITYKTTEKGEAVYLAGKRSGIIKAVFGGWAYFPKGRKGHGECFSNIYQVKQSLER